MDPQKILNRLLNTEFKELKEEYGDIKIKWRYRPMWSSILKFFGIKPKRGTTATAWTASFDGIFFNIIYLNKLHKKKILGNENRIKETLRHECLHLLINYRVRSRDFNKEAHRRRIDYESKKLARSRKGKKLYYYEPHFGDFCWFEKIKPAKAKASVPLFRAKDKKLIIDNVNPSKEGRANDTLVVEIPAGRKERFAAGNRLEFLGTATGIIGIKNRPYLEIEIIPEELYSYSLINVNGKSGHEECMSLEPSRFQKTLKPPDSFNRVSGLFYFLPTNSAISARRQA